MYLYTLLFNLNMNKLLHIIVMCYLLYSVTIMGKSIKSFNTINNNDVYETQFSNCQITTDQLIANAQATFTRVLTNDDKNVDEKFKHLESILLNQFNEMKMLINEMKLSKDDDFVSPRQHEINKYNGSVYEVMLSNGRISKVFNYFWRISEIRNKLLNWKIGMSERSDTLSIKQVKYSIFMKFTPKYFPDGTVFISVGLTKGLYDNDLDWPFSLPLQIEILDHNPLIENRQDRVSKLWDPLRICPSYFWERPSTNDNYECVGLSVPRNALIYNNSRYIWNDSLFIKLTVYFNNN